jgi:hypothetical protein
MAYRYIAEFDIGETIILDEGTKLIGTVKSVTFGSDRQPAYFVEFGRPKDGAPGTMIYEGGHMPEGKLRRPVDDVEAAASNPATTEKAAAKSFLAAVGEVSGLVDKP